MTVRGIEAINVYLPPSNEKINPNVREERGIEVIDKKKVTTTMTSVERYRQEWISLLRNLKESPESIRNAAFNGDLKVSKFRSIYWSLLLRVLHGDPNTWMIQREQQRRRYEHLKKEFVKNPHEMTTANDDPLSQSTQSIWNQYFNDQELYNVINQDVIRTFPGVDFFRKAVIQNYMSNILFYYSREHPYMCYRQGMHEILAPIIFVLYGDHQGFLHYKEITKEEIDPILLNVINPEYLEADSYSIFSRLMSSVESYYRVPQNSQDLKTSPMKKTSNDASSEIEIVAQLNKIRDKILAKEDLHLHNHLLKLEIPLHIFGIRWLRLLFGREFLLLDLLVLWDAIFADSDRFDLPNYILVAMLIRIRDKLLLSDYTTALTYLMRYPSHVDVTLILKHALHMQMPKRFERPPNAFIYCTANSSQSTSKKGSKLSNFNNPQFENHTKYYRPRSSSMSEVILDKEIIIYQTQNAADLALTKRKKEINDGFSENNPEMLRLELKNAQTIIGIARNKLIGYMETIRRHTVKNNSEQLAQALDGIEELCTYLDIKLVFPLHAPVTPIDMALEANELQRKAREMTPSINSEIEESKTFGLADASEVTSFSSLMPNSIGAAVAASKTPYEKPDVTHSLLLGNQKEIELITITSDEKAVRSTKNFEYVQSSSCIGLPKLDPLSHREN